MPVGMKDIARDLGVSVVTVSKALRNHPDISKPTRERILQRVQELNYRPNLTARSLVTGRSSLVGLIVPDLIHPFFADVAKGLSTTLRQQGYFVLVSSSEEDPELERQEIEHMLAHRLEAIVIASCQPDAESFLRLQHGETLVVLVDRSFKSYPSHFVGSDDYIAGKLATEHLLAVGCRRIAHIRGTDNSVGTRRLKGFLDTMKKHDVAVLDEHIIRVPRVDVDGNKYGREVVSHLKEMKHMPDGIFCYNDVIAMGVLAGAYAHGIRVPEDVAVIGCGNLHYDSEISVPLSSIDQRSNEIGSRTAKLILKVLGADGPTKFSETMLVPRLAARASTARRGQEAASSGKKRRNGSGTLPSSARS
jgi:LacI family transcriptional regulator